MPQDGEQLSLPLLGQPMRPESIGGVSIEYRDATSILTPASGFMSGYDFTLNPYSGCSFGCTYCYAAFFARETTKRDTWGEWLVVKQNAEELLNRLAKRGLLKSKSIYLSSVTDPYVPIDQQLGITRALLQILVKHDVRLVVQTRGPLVTRDIDLFKQFRAIRVHMTVTTDAEDVRKVFEPRCPANRRRLAAIAEVAAAGVPTRITLTPLLPVADPSAFALALQETGVREFVVQPFHSGRGKFVRGTRDEALRLTDKYRWTPERYQDTLAVLRRRLPVLFEGQEGFAPV